MTYKEELRKNSDRIRRRVLATKYAFSGIRLAWKNETSFRQECVLLFIALIIAPFIASSVLEYIMLIGTILLVLMTELINSAVESVCDRVTTENDALIRRAKDYCAAAVFVSLVFAGITWLLLLLR